MGGRGVNASFKWFLPVFATRRGRGEGIRAVWVLSISLVYLPEGSRSSDTCEHRLSSFEFFNKYSETYQCSVSAWDLNKQGLLFYLSFVNKCSLGISPNSSSIITTHQHRGISPLLSTPEGKFVIFLFCHGFVKVFQWLLVFGTDCDQDRITWGNPQKWCSDSLPF